MKALITYLCVCLVCFLEHYFLKIIIILLIITVMKNKYYYQNKFLAKLKYCYLYGPWLSLMIVILSMVFPPCISGVCIMHVYTRKKHCSIIIGIFIRTSTKMKYCHFNLEWGGKLTDLPDLHWSAGKKYVWYCGQSSWSSHNHCWWRLSSLADTFGI